MILSSSLNAIRERETSFRTIVCRKDLNHSPTAVSGIILLAAALTEVEVVGIVCDQTPRTQLRCRQRRIDILDLQVRCVHAGRATLPPCRGKQLSCPLRDPHLWLRLRYQLQMRFMDSPIWPCTLLPLLPAWFSTEGVSCSCRTFCLRA